MLINDWVQGELVRNALKQYQAPACERRSYALLNHVYDLHAELAKRGWIANDFYDGSMIYDFLRRQRHAVDFDTYLQGPFTIPHGPNVRLRPLHGPRGISTTRDH